MKIAIVHDELMRRGGAEQVVRCFHEAFPKAPIFTMIFQPEKTFPVFKECDVRTSWFNNLASDEKRMKWLFFPFGILAMKQLDVTGYDVVLISSTYCAKYVKVSPQALVITYCYTPFRFAWNPESYSEYNNAVGLKRKVFNQVVRTLKHTDYKAAQRTDNFIAMTEETRGRIVSAYHPRNPIHLIKPPVDCRNFYVSDKPKEYFLVVSRLEYYKKVDLVVDAFNELGLPLIIVGKGSKEVELKKRAKANIVFKSGLSSQEISELYAGCKAFVFPQHEDYGITPLEANASGRPVIAFGKGGVLETMIPKTENNHRATAVFFKRQTVESLVSAIEAFDEHDFDPHFIRRHAEQFNEDKFVAQVKNYVLTLYEKWMSPKRVEADLQATR